jgi:hypothetical protein
MSDIWAGLSAPDRATVERLAETLELRAAEPQQRHSGLSRSRSLSRSSTRPRVSQQSIGDRSAAGLRRAYEAPSEEPR